MKLDMIDLPFTPIQFSYSETIGTASSKPSQSLYLHQFTDILIPHILPHHNPFFYLLFHTPSVYNWLKTIISLESRLLNTYISCGQTKSAGVQKIKVEDIKKSLDEYAKKWEVIKLTFSCKVFVRRPIGINPCTHLLKTEVYTSLVEYSQKLTCLLYPSLYCRDCQQSFPFECEIKEYSNCILITSPSEPTLLLPNNITYSLYLLFEEETIYIKCANKIWYEVKPSLKSIKPIGFSRLDLKKAIIGAYSLPPSQSPFLQSAIPFLQQSKNQEVEQVKIRDFSFPREQLHQQESKGKVPRKGDKKQLKELKPNRSEILLHQDSKEYIEQVSKMYLSPKVKDEYELNYDKGKTKKRKIKKDYILPNFNQIHQKLKSALLPQKQGKSIKKNKKKILNNDEDKDED